MEDIESNVKLAAKPVQNAKPVQDVKQPAKPVQDVKQPAPNIVASATLDESGYEVPLRRSRRDLICGSASNSDADVTTKNVSIKTTGSAATVNSKKSKDVVSSSNNTTGSRPKGKAPDASNALRVSSAATSSSSDNNSNSSDDSSGDTNTSKNNSSGNSNNSSDNQSTSSSGDSDDSSSSSATSDTHKSKRRKSDVKITSTSKTVKSNGVSKGAAKDVTSSQKKIRTKPLTMIRTSPRRSLGGEDSSSDSEEEKGDAEPFLKSPRDKRAKLVASVLSRWWYCMPDWPPVDYPFEKVLEENKLQLVAIDDWDDLGGVVNDKGLTPVYQVSHYPGVFRDSSGKAIDLRPTEGKPCYKELNMKTDSELYELLAKALQGQLDALPNSPFWDTDRDAVAKIEVSLKQSLERANFEFTKINRRRAYLQQRSKDSSN